MSPFKDLLGWTTAGYVLGGISVQSTLAMDKQEERQKAPHRQRIKESSYHCVLPSVFPYEEKMSSSFRYDSVLRRQIACLSIAEWNLLPRCQEEESQPSECRRNTKEQACRHTNQSTNFYHFLFLFTNLLLIF